MILLCFAPAAPFTHHTKRRRTKTARNFKPDTAFNQCGWSSIKSWFSSSELVFFLSLDSSYTNTKQVKAFRMVALPCCRTFVPQGCARKSSVSYGAIPPMILPPVPGKRIWVGTQCSSEPVHASQLELRRHRIERHHLLLRIVDRP